MVNNLSRVDVFVFEENGKLGTKKPIRTDELNLYRETKSSLLCLDVAHISFKIHHFWSAIWSNYSDLTRPHPKWWFSFGKSFYFRNLTRAMMFVSKEVFLNASRSSFSHLAGSSLAKWHLYASHATSSSSWSAFWWRDWQRFFFGGKVPVSQAWHTLPEN